MIKVLIANYPRPLSDCINDLIRTQPDMTVVGEVFDPIKMLVAVGEVDADIVVMTQEEVNEEAGVCSHLLGEYPDLSILVLAQDGRNGCLYHQEVTKRLLTDLSDEGILAAIRSSEAT
jgi:chemotaxis response regulator CheB